MNQPGNQKVPLQGKAPSKATKQKKPPKRYLTTGRVGQMLEVSPAAIKKWIRQGKLAAFRTPGGHFRILAGEFERFRRNHGFTTTAAEPLRVLLIDDDRAVADLLGSSLRALYPKTRIETAANGFEGLLKVGGLRPDLLLLDLGLPGMDGLEVCRQIKRDPANRETKIVVLTAPLHDAEPRARDAGADGVLRKPLEADDVHALLAQLFGRRF
jgi:excisionase family DNA binding protein